MRFTIMALFFFAFTTCKTQRPPEQPKGPIAFRIMVPDSLSRIKAGLEKFYARWNSRQDLPFTFSDTASHFLLINDSIKFQNSVFQLEGDTVYFRQERLPLHSTLIAVKADGYIRMISAGSVRIWFLLEVLFELFENYSDRSEAVLIHSGNQMVLKSHRTPTGWQDDLNVFEKRRHYETQPDVDERFFRFNGGSIRYDSVAMDETMSHYPPHLLRKYLPTIYVYPDYETKSQICSNVMEYSYYLPKNQIHMVNGSLTEKRFREIISVYYAFQIHGDAAPRLTEGLGIYYAKSYFGKPFGWWEPKRSLLHLIRKENLLSKPQENENTFLYLYLSVLFWTENHGSVGTVFNSPATSINNFNPHMPPISAKPVGNGTIPYFKGFSYAHSNGVSTGYMSLQSKQSMGTLAGLGTNAVSLTPFGYAKNETESTVYFVLDNTWDETLGGLFKATEDAQTLGMHVMMKPHIWLGNGKWCGEITITDSAELKKWENAYSQLITYHGLIAELSGMQSLCVAVELPHMFQHTEMWRRIICCARTAFSGPVTYGANWMDEYDGIKFWDDLDFIGIQTYFPLSHSKNETSSDFYAHTKELSLRLSEFSKQWDRPIVFTEAGFPSIEHALLNPHQEDFSQKRSDEAQALGYTLLFEEFSHQPWFKGFFWWKWESGNSSRRSTEKSFHIRRKKAEAVVKKFYLYNTETNK